jgi:hypothetical protein
MFALVNVSLAFGAKPSGENKPDAKISSAVLGLPMSFEPNRGQTDPNVKFLCAG